MRRMERKGVDSLTALRGIFLTWLEAIALILFILVLLSIGVGSEDDPGISPPVLSGGIAILGVIAIRLVVWARSKELNLAGEDKLRDSYASKFFLGMALSQAVFLVGFVGFFTSDSWAPILVSLPFTLVGFSLIAPSAANLSRHQQEISMKGSSLSLTSVLVSSRFKRQRG